MITKREFETGDIYIRQMNFSEVDDRIPEHTHNFGHTTIVNFGKFMIKSQREGVDFEEAVGPGQTIFVPAEAEHAITCVEPGQAMCVFAHRNADGSIATRMTGEEAAYV